MKTILLLLALSLTAAAAGPSQLKISAPHHPDATARITTHGCENGILRYNGSFIVATKDVHLDHQGKGSTRLLANDKELSCHHGAGVEKEWVTWYTVQILGSADHKEKILKLRAGKTSTVKL